MVNTQGYILARGSNSYTVIQTINSQVTFNVANRPVCSWLTAILILAKQDTVIPFKDLETEVRVNGDLLFGPIIAPPVPSTDLLPEIVLIC